MARNEDPLGTWEMEAEYRAEPEARAYYQEQITTTLDRLAAALADPQLAKRGWYEFGLQWRAGSERLSPADLPRAKDLYGRAQQVGGTGTTWLQEGLLDRIGATADPGNVPFWIEVLKTPQARGAFPKVRRTYALAALAFIAIQHDTPDAYAALRAATQHDNADVRALAVHYLGRAYLDSERDIPDEVAADLARIGTTDSAFGPRFRARNILRAAGFTVPNDYPDGSYSFKVTLKGLKGVSRTIEVRADQTLDDLHSAIQDAYEWDADHLYSFYMDGKARGSDYEIACPEPDGGFFGPGLFRIVEPGETGDATAPALHLIDLDADLTEEDEEADEDDEEAEEGGDLTTFDAVLGELGLVPKQKFLYLFDYGDNNLFAVQVAGIRPQAEAGDYPRVVASQCDAPEQYPSWDDDDEEFDEDGAEDEAGD